MIFIQVEVSVQQQVLDLIKEDPKITIAEMGNNLNTAVRTINRILTGSKNENIIKRSGSKKEGLCEIL